MLNVPIGCDEFQLFPITLPGVFPECQGTSRGNSIKFCIQWIPRLYFTPRWSQSCSGKGMGTSLVLLRRFLSKISICGAMLKHCLKVTLQIQISRLSIFLPSFYFQELVAKGSDGQEEMSYLQKFSLGPKQLKKYPLQNYTSKIYEKCYSLNKYYIYFSFFS